MNRKKIFIYLGLALVVALVFYLLRDEAEENGWFLSEEEKKAKAEWMAKGGPPGGGSSEADDPNYLEKLDQAVPPEKVLKDYLEWAEYPPNSRPLTKYNSDLLDPYFIPLVAIPMVDHPQDKKGNGYSCKLQPLQWAAIGIKDPLHITLECFGPTYERAPLDVRNVKLWKEFDGIKYPALPPYGNDHGIDGDVRAKDNVFTFEWRPSYKDWGDMYLEVEFVYGKEKKQGKLMTSFFSSPNQPAEWSGYFLDNAKEGSLNVKAGLNIFKAGTYHLEGNLVNAANGEPIAWASFDGKLAAGRQEVDFLFYGKLIRESDYEGPYALTQLRGHRVNLAVDPDWFGQGEDGMKKILAAKTTEPDKELVAPYKEKFTTKEYSMNSFSLKAWEAPEKDQKIKQLQDMVK
ncbi:hypothetical protein EHQ53_09130 [Leptospira langatensis]|uniref:Uncharacterized protein n=1 Tax=Leptospira langatensis TaxID=2484983 RepID=A0A5F1ZV47_9LEPT|nr:hypothetical protein [Leptospira langatensis]TGK01220.1 hypothetical protein EHO57_09745 [Leptospira langatensis]TGL42330.1 hypothetical protein EHQ53_09130 [Leptospira langatensis]